MIQILTVFGAVAVVLLAVVCVLSLPLIFGVVILAAFVLWVWMLIDAIRNNQLSGWERVGWAVLIWFTHWIGALIYFCVARKCRWERIQPTTLVS